MEKEDLNGCDALLVQVDNLFGLTERIALDRPKQQKRIRVSRLQLIGMQGLPNQTKPWVPINCSQLHESFFAILLCQLSFWYCYKIY